MPKKIKNRSFEFPKCPYRLDTFRKGECGRIRRATFERNPRYVTLAQEPHNSKHTGLQNEGFFGVSFKKGEEYRFSVYGRHGQKQPGNDTRGTRRSGVKRRVDGCGISQKSMSTRPAGANTQPTLCPVSRCRKVCCACSLRKIPQEVSTLTMYRCFPSTRGMATRTVCERYRHSIGRHKARTAPFFPAVA